MTEVIAVILFVFSFFLISFERVFRTSKAAIALVLGGALWLIVVLMGKSHAYVQAAFQQTGNEIFGILMFLLASMALVELMARHHFFEYLKEKLLELSIDVRKQFIFLSLGSFFLSAMLDNMTVGLLMVQVARHFFKGRNMLIAAAAIVIGANAGGSFSPIGDVTTVLLWIAGKYDALTVIREGFLPAVAFLLVSCGILYFQLDPSDHIAKKEENPTILSKKDKLVIAGSSVSFLLPVLANNIGLPPYIGLLFGLGILWLFLQYENVTQKGSSVDVMEDIFKQLDIASVNFYVGILLAANALNALGILEALSRMIFGATQEFMHVVWGSALVGVLFAFFDNIPLTAVTMKLVTLPNQSLWVLLALTIGNGGSILLLGSAAGIAVMSGVKELTMSKYIKFATIPTLIAYIVMLGVWYAQYLLVLK